MIVADRKPLEEILVSIEPYNKIMLAGCGGCVTICFSGGAKAAELLASQIRMARKKQGRNIEIVERTPERELLPMARELDLAVTPWAILGAGVLTGKYTREGGTDGTERLLTEEDRARVALTERNLSIAREVDAVAEEAGCTPSQVAIAWMRSRPGVIVPILGARSVAQLEDNLGALDVDLSAEQLGHLDEASAIEPGFPTDFLESTLVRDLMYGGRLDDIDDHRPH